MKKFLYIIIACLIAVITFTLLFIKTGESNMTNNKVLVAYFSATGNTKTIAEKLANEIGADLFEIKPAQIYTDDDLNWQNDKSRSSVEMADRNSRPGIASKIDDFAQYKTVFIGFPIWWGREPSIIDTFMESYDFAGKTIIPFATSGSSDIGNSGEIIQSLVPNATVLHGKRFSTSVSDTELKNWAIEQM